MRRLIFRRLSERLGNESGVTIVFIAVLLIGLLAMTAFVIDFGRIWQERRELQLGATAGVLAIAEDCARELCGGGYSESSTADTYADANAGDGAAAVSAVDLDLNARTVYVEAATENTAGGDTLNMLFAPVLGFDTITIGSDAKAAWGTPLNASTLPIILSECEWENPQQGWPNGGANLPVYSPGASLPVSDLVTITFHEPQGTGDECTAQPGFDSDGDGMLPGGFGWIDITTGCSSEIEQETWIGTDPGANVPRPCSQVLANLLGKPFLVPYFKDVNGIVGQGNTGEYLIAGHGAFVLGGYRFAGNTGGVPGCGPPNTCLSGWFVKHVFHGGGPGGLGGEDRGAIVIKLIG